LAPQLPIFLKSAYIISAHSVLQSRCRLGYTSAWTDKHFGTAERKNVFFEEVGATLKPEQEDTLAGLNSKASPDAILKKVRM